MRLDRRICPSRPPRAGALQDERNPLDALWWLLSVALILAGLAGTVLPALPGTALVLAGIVLGAWIDGFTRVGPWAVGAVVVMAVLAWVLDYVAALLGARRAGASRQALIGAALGTVVGLFMGLVGVLFMPLVGAAAGEYLAQRDQRQAMKVGLATWLGLMAGLLAKVVLAFMMIGVFIVALLV
ncbi:MAG: DUF456 family protein [Rubrivivax sp.]|nr:DUF456 family protein [Rubrivivax sp.]